MKKDKIEIRKNGDEIRKKGRCYHVYRKQKNGTFELSKNGPWDYLCNARSDSNTGMINGKAICTDPEDDRENQ